MARPSVVRTAAACCAALVLGGTSGATASAPVASGSRVPFVTVETALIVWHPDTRREHLLLAARIEHAEGRVAYVMPAPSEPRVAPVQADLSTAFARLIGDYRARTPRWEVPSLPGGAPRPWLTFGEQGAADSVVVQLSSGASIEATLRTQGYELDEAVHDWLVGCEQSATHVAVMHVPGTGPTRSLPYTHAEFESVRPYFPYREPSRPADDVRGGTTAGTTRRLLRVYVLTVEPVAMRLGSSVATMAQAWLSYEPTHAELRRAFGGDLYERLELDAARRYWLTSFEDYHLVRPGNDDAWFDRQQAIPRDGEPGTVGDRGQAGIALTPLAPDGLEEVAARDAAVATEGEQRQSGSAYRCWGRRRKAALLWAGLAGALLAGWWWSTAKRV